jgi:hypothetical protein
MPLAEHCALQAKVLTCEVERPPRLEAESDDLQGLLQPPTGREKSRPYGSLFSRPPEPMPRMGGR